MGRAHEGTSLRDHLHVLRRRKWVVLQAVVLVPVVAVLVSLRQDDQYRATADVLLNSQNIALTLTGTGDTSSRGTPERVAETQAQLARVPEVARRALASARRWDRTPEALLFNSSVVANPRADLLLFAVTDPVPEVASLLATKYAQEYTRYRRELDTGAIKRARVDIEREIARLERTDQRQSTLYDSLVEKQQQLRTMEALQTSNASVVREAGSAVKIAPTPKRNALLGLALGLVLGLGIAFIWEALDTRVRSVEELERLLGLPLLARVPRPPRDLERAERLVMQRDRESTEAEAFRVLRTNLDFFNLEIEARTVMVTSAVSEEGKSTTIANLAVALALSGQRVVLVDLDLRRPILDRFFRFRGRAGVTDIAFGDAQLDPVDLGALAATKSGRGDRTGSLEVLTAGTIRSVAGDFIGSERLGTILDDLRERADIVLIDAPPLLLVGDAMQLAARVDAVIVVARLGVVRRQMLVEVRRALGASRVAKLGFVATGAELEPDYRYAYSAYPYYTRSAERKPTA